jgi:hypothetical protein
METIMRILLAAAAVMAMPIALSAQQSADDLNARSQPAPATTTVIPNPGSPATVVHNPDGSVTVNANPGAPAVVIRDNPGNLTPPPASALNKTYPVCTRTLQDNCQNPGEGGAPGRSRALSYWPGQPSSERRGR